MTDFQALDMFTEASHLVSIRCLCQYLTATIRCHANNFCVCRGLFFSNGIFRSFVLVSYFWSKRLPIHICSIPWWLPRKSCNKLEFALCWIQVFFDQFPINYTIAYTIIIYDLGISLLVKIGYTQYMIYNIYIYTHVSLLHTSNARIFQRHDMSIFFICPLHWETRTQKCHHGVHVCNAPGRRCTTIQEYSRCAGCLTFNRFTTTKRNSH